ncbi:MAG: hypothetical protein QFB86_04560 [Patescibacteria group bacterium]|nr:hypothetical protein [Patescibacteria group bacterium]
MAKSIEKLLSIDLFDFPQQCANPANDFRGLKDRVEILQRKQRELTLAQTEAGQSLAILTVAMALNPAISELLQPTTLEEIIGVTQATPKSVLHSLVEPRLHK